MPEFDRQEWRIKNTFLDFNETPGKELMRRRSTKTAVRRSQPRIAVSLDALLAKPSTPDLISAKHRWSSARDADEDCDSDAGSSSASSQKSISDAGSSSPEIAKASIPSAAELEPDIASLSVGEDRTTVMIRNLPNKYPQRKLLKVLSDKGISNYDFFYLPMDFRNKCNVGYGFVNFGDSKSAIHFMKIFDAFQLPETQSLKRIEVSWAKTQGFRRNAVAMCTRAVMKSDMSKDFRPIIFDLENGEEIQFPTTKEGIMAMKGVAEK